MSQQKFLSTDSAADKYYYPVSHDDLYFALRLVLQERCKATLSVCVAAATGRQCSATEYSAAVQRTTLRYRTGLRTNAV